MDLLRVITCGSVDDGKSTLFGRLLHDTKSILEDQWRAIERASGHRDGAGVNLAFVTDGLRAEREQGITIDVAYRYFSTGRRKFILADCPGHFEYTRNMVTGASTAQLALLLVDASRGIGEQTRRHAFLVTLMGIRHLVVCVNKMDLVAYSEARFAELREEFMAYAARFESVDIHFLPISALHGENVVERSSRMPWSSDAPLLHALETVYVRNDANHIDPRFPIQLVLGTGRERRYAGCVASGVFRLGDEVVHVPSGTHMRIRELRGPKGAVREAFHPMSVSMAFDRAIDAIRGDMIARPFNRPHLAANFDAIICWLDDSPWKRDVSYRLRHTTRETSASIVDFQYKLDVQTLRRQRADGALRMNEITRVAFTTSDPLFLDGHRRNRQTGCFILLDPCTGATVAAGVVLDR